MPLEPAIFVERSVVKATAIAEVDDTSVSNSRRRSGAGLGVVDRAKATGSNDT
jgi:hypothetical protein